VKNAVMDTVSIRIVKVAKLQIASILTVLIVILRIRVGHAKRVILARRKMQLVELFLVGVSLTVKIITVTLVSLKVTAISAMKGTFLTLAPLKMVLPTTLARLSVTILTVKLARVTSIIVLNASMTIYTLGMVSANLFAQIKTAIPVRTQTKIIQIHFTKRASDARTNTETIKASAN